MSRSILRKDHSEDQGMEQESKSDEPFLKIETIWSESQGNFESILVKEENISDVEPENLFKEPQQETYDFKTGEKSDIRSPDKIDNQEIKSFQENGAIVRREGCNKKVKSKGSHDGINCLHDAKNFKVIKKRLRCSDCKATLCPECYCTINSTVQNHFSKSDNNNRSLYHCKLCCMIFKSNCALQAHLRIHLLDTPYVCPDCGAVYNNIYFLSLHLINKCHHVYKIIKSGCKFCLSQNMAPEDYTSHIEEAHIKPIYKCPDCELMFESTSEMNKHLGTSHKYDNVTPLHYFCCSICGNLIISKQIYAKHIKYHQEYSAAFQIGYLCPCGHSFSTACSFRGHFRSCSKKGVLPPKWTFLQVTLKTHEMLQVQNDIEKSMLNQPESARSSNPAYSSNDLIVEQRKMNFRLFQGGDSSDDCDDLSEEASRNSSNESDLCSKKNNQYKSNEAEEDICCCDVPIPDHSGRNSADTVIKTEENQEKEILEESPEQSLDGQRKNNENTGKSCEGGAQSFQDQEKEIFLDEDDNRAENPPLIPNVQLVEEFSIPPQGENVPQLQQEKEKKNIEKTGRVSERNLKMIYDHIPCDHLGYLKTQQRPELLDKTVKKDTPKTSEFPQNTYPTGTGSENYLITSVLDEKTGFMKTKKVLIQKNQAENGDPDYEAIDLLGNAEFLSNITSRDVLKTKSSTFFSCPFCSVLFPKHYSSFQKFRLHLECYHPDAALDITVDRTHIPKSQTQFTSITMSDDNESDNDSCDLDDIDLQTRLNSIMESNKDDVVCESTSVTIGENPHGEDKKKKGASVMGCNSQNNRPGKHDSEMKLRSSTNFENKERGNIHNNGNVSHSSLMKSGRRNSFNRKTSESNGSLFKPSLIQSISQLKNSEMIERNLVRLESQNNDVNTAPADQVECPSTLSSFVDDDNSESLDSESSMKNTESNKNIDDILLKLDGNEQAKRFNILHRKQISILNHKSKRMCENKFLRVSPTNTFREEGEDDKRSHMSSGSENDNLSSYLRASREKEHYFKSLRDGSKTPTDERANESRNSEKSNELDVPRRSVERRNSRRESDVWSEFYKTLKIAETLKKTNVKNRGKYGGGEASILTNYTNKRVVKKPKRYRESSDSEESEDGKQSPCFSKSIDNKVDREDDELYIKKKKLIRRLENVDYRILNYVFKLLERKKNQGLLKKNTEGSVKSYRKKVQNGVRMPGKQLKPGADNDSYGTESADKVKDIYEFNGDDTEWEVPTGTSSEDKSGDKKRGRPKKTEALMMKERRRSDLEKEISFLDKIFDADENDLFTMKRKRKLSSKIQYNKKMAVSSEKNDFSSGQVISTKMSETEKKLTCAVCKLSYQNEQEFKEHIRTHRVDDNNHQCMECGECFVVRPSLEKHLHAFHKIKDVQKYIEENDCSATEKAEDADAEPLKENQCKVCKDEFANVHDLNKHFRIHGMAFLRQFKKDKTN